MIGRTIGELAVGEAAELVRVVREGDVAEFVESVGDRNPVHSDPGFAATTSFREPIAPGIWTAGLISAVIGTRLPGPGSIYERQELRFVRPVRVGDTVTARVEVSEIIRDRNRVRLKTVCLNQRGEEVLVGEAWVLPPRTRVRYDDDISGIRCVAFWAFQPWAVAAQALSFWWMICASVLAVRWLPGLGARARELPVTLRARR